MALGQQRRPPAILAVCCLSLLIVGVDNTIVTVALPTLRTSLHAGLSSTQWTIDAYQIVLGAFLVSAGALADRWGRRRALQTGLAVFTVGTALCSVAPTVGWLITFRVIQALGGSMMNPVAMAIVAQAYPDPRARAKAFGVWSGVYGLSMAIGPVAGGVLVAGSGWRSVFWATIPICLLAIILCARIVPESRAANPRRIDGVGQLLLITALGVVTFTVIEGRVLGWGSPTATGLLGLFVACAIGFLLWERRCAEPLIDLSFFRSVPFTAGVLISLVGMGAAGGYLWVMTFYLQNGRGMSAEHAGLYLLPIAIAVLIVAPLSGRLAAHRGPRSPLMISGVCTACSGALLTGLDARTSTAVLVMSFITFGVGFGMLNAPITNIAVSGMPRAQASVAAAIASTGRQVGQAIGVAVVGALIIPRLGNNVGASLPQASQVGWWAIAGAGVVVVVVTYVATTTAARATSERIADGIGTVPQAP